jgi:hypothetical protein
MSGRARIIVGGITQGKARGKALGAALAAGLNQDEKTSTYQKKAAL